MRLKLFVCLLAFSMLCPLFAACGSEKTPDSTGDTTADSAPVSSVTPETSETTSETTTETESLPEYDALEKLGDITGEFRILCGLSYAQNDFKAEDENGTVLQTAIYRRNAYMKDTYNVEIVSEELNWQNCYNKVITEYTSGESSYDAAMLKTNVVADLATSGCLHDLNDIEYVDLTRDYWDQKANEDLSISGRMYYTTGDIGVIDNMVTHCMLFNKKMVKDYGVDDLYQLVRDDKWTLETLATMVRSVGEDANQDGVYDENDVYGLMTWLDNVQAVLAGAGERICTVNENGELELTLYSQRTVDLYDDFTSLVYDNTHVYNYQYDYKTGDRSSSGVWDKNRVKMFDNNQAMFYYTMLTTVARHRDSETDFGILPYPKYDAEQDSYYHGVGVNQCAFICVPEMVQNHARAGFILEELAYQGKKLLTPAYYEQTLVGQYTRDEESAEMLDIIFSTRLYDVGLYYNVGKYKDALANMFVTRKTLTTIYESYRDSAQTTIDTINEKFAAQAETAN